VFPRHPSATGVSSPSENPPRFARPSCLSNPSPSRVEDSSGPSSIVRRVWRFAPVIMATFLLVGCARNHPTAPSAGSQVASGDSTQIGDSTLTANLATSTSLGGPLAGLDAGSLARFNDGLTEFQAVETPAEGLGPVFNEASCATCHNTPVGGTTGRAETRFGKWDRGRFDALAQLGGSLIQDHAIGFVGAGRHKFEYVPEVVPRVANASTKRITTPLFGLGLVDAVTDVTLLALARNEARNTPSTAGRPNMVQEISTGATRVGRFGWKAQVPTLHQFSGDAYLNEMGITNPEFPNENAPQGNRDALAFNPLPALNDDGTGVAKFADFMTLLGPPPRGPRTSQTDAGSTVFAQIGCASCHTPTLRTGDSPVAALSNKAFQPYSDFLLHDMGQLGDAIVQGQAGRREMRTAPLWGLRSRPVFLHDGRASTPEAAILAHDGQGRGASSRFSRLSTRDRQALLAFLRSL
jgi:CxxC motif-containing protein (DUF1111 family)